MLNIHDLKAAYEKAIGHSTSDSTVYNLLHRHGWRKLMPCPFHPKRDLVAQKFSRYTMLLKRPAFSLATMKPERSAFACEISKLRIFPDRRNHSNDDPAPSSLGTSWSPFH
jgi:hypothetical protein